MFDELGSVKRGRNINFDSLFQYVIYYSRTEFMYWLDQFQRGSTKINLKFFPIIFTQEIYAISIFLYTLCFIQFKCVTLSFKRVSLLGKLVTIVHNYPKGQVQ